MKKEKIIIGIIIITMIGFAALLTLPLWKVSLYKIGSDTTFPYNGCHSTLEILPYQSINYPSGYDWSGYKIEWCY